MISVIIPNYNRTNSLVRAINSILEQDYIGDIEIIIVDDKSPDILKIETLVKDIKLPSNMSLYMLRHTENKFASSARNTGIKEAKGDYIALLDSDDCWESNYLTIQLDFLKRHGSKVILFGVCKNILLEGEWLQPTRGLLSGECVDEYIFLHKQCCQTSTLFSSVSAFKNNLFDETLKAFQDPSFAINATANGYQMIFNQSAIVNRYLDWRQGNDHVGRKVDEDYLKFWLVKHEEKMSQLGVDAFNIRYFKKGRGKVICKYLFNSYSFSFLRLGLREIVKSYLSHIYNFSLIRKLRVKIK
ncbi:glycosyltransferase family 2 protein [Pseudoalteromonas carrageenovora]|uniref:glycosyltransferase family 2 protein n=1 Tax=Pseudoalteromonas carrageenovora TaxID=227 RepID=UPI0026E198E4|nr:glycosyltransferase family 2 protein [Pseudoalteromonas carrageenovora]MDO6635780.1 glycosyltransferase family 2 protein [Pseudoalteromonas carrageenovora]MDO6647773.1 glycosyltransferase family 2 protein [Pseudoalteromonas carrageenovora]